MSDSDISKIGLEYIRNSVSFTVDGEFLESYDVHELFAINESAITQEMATHSAKYGRIAVLLGRAERYRAYMKQQVEVEYAVVDDIMRDEYKDTGEKYTETVIRSAVLVDGQYNMVVSNHDDASTVVFLLKNMLQAMKVKGDMLISIGAQLRAEMSMTGMTITDDYDKTVNVLKESLRKKE